MLVPLPHDHTAGTVAQAPAGAITAPPAPLRRPLTRDQGTEMAAHARFRVATGVPVSFRAPHRPGQPGSNQNTHGPLRPNFPRSTDVNAGTQSHLDAVAAELNDRPRPTLEWKSPCQALDQALR